VKRRRWCLLPLLVAATVGCTPTAPTLDLDNGQLRLAMTEPDLVTAINTWVAAIYHVDDDGPGCHDLIDMVPSELERERQRQPSSAAAAAFTLADDRSGIDFGRVEPAGARALVMLGSTRELGDQTVGDGELDPSQQILPQLTGSIVAIGCRELQIESDRRFAADVVLFPAGLR
jgi:hypothetical protein